MNEYIRSRDGEDDPDMKLRIADRKKIVENFRLKKYKRNKQEKIKGRKDQENKPAASSTEASDPTHCSLGATKKEATMSILKGDAKRACAKSRKQRNITWGKD